MIRDTRDIRHVLALSLIGAPCFYFFATTAAADGGGREITEQIRNNYLKFRWNEVCEPITKRDTPVYFFYHEQHISCFLLSGGRHEEVVET